MAVNDEILDQSLQCLRFHFHPEWGDQDLLDVFNRLLAKNIRPNRWTPHTHLDIQRHHVTSRRERWTTDALWKLLRGHDSTAGRDFDCPIIVAEYEGKLRVLDGNHRINRWVADGDTRSHDVNIHTVTAIGQFIERPAAGRGA